MSIPLFIAWVPKRMVHLGPLGIILNGFQPSPFLLDVVGEHTQKSPKKKCFLRKSDLLRVICPEFFNNQPASRTKGSYILPTQTMHCYFREIHQNCHRFVVFDPSKISFNDPWQQSINTINTAPPPPPKKKKHKNTFSNPQTLETQRGYDGSYFSTDFSAAF